MPVRMRILSSPYFRPIYFKPLKALEQLNPEFLKPVITCFGGREIQKIFSYFPVVENFSQ